MNLNYIIQHWNTYEKQLNSSYINVKHNIYVKFLTKGLIKIKRTYSVKKCQLVLQTTFFKGNYGLLNQLSVGLGF